MLMIVKYTYVNFFSEPPESFSILQNKAAVDHGGKVTVVDGKVSICGFFFNLYLADEPNLITVVKDPTYILNCEIINVKPAKLPKEPTI